MTLLRSRADLAAKARSEPVRWTHLQHMLESSAHYLDSFHDEDDTPEKRIGRVVDAYVLGGPEPVIFPGRRQGEGWERFKKHHAGREILTVAENDAAKYTADAIEANRHAMEVLSGGEAHREIRWKYKGRDCVSHPDYSGQTFTTELKVTNTAHPDRFMAHARKKGYPLQLAMYDHALGLTQRRWYIVAAQHKRPYAVTVFRMTDEQKARNGFMDLFDRLLECERTDRWPEYAEGIVDFAAEGETLDSHEEVL